MRLIASRRMVWGRGAALRVAPGYVVVDRARIVEAVRGDEDPKQAAEARGAALEEFGERLVSPAFVNAHTHLALVFARALDPGSATAGNTVEEFFFRVERKLTYDDVRALSRMGAYESLLAGVGLVWDHYYFASAVAEALRDVGLCGVVAPTLQDVAGPGADGWEAALAETEALHGSAELEAAGIATALGPHATDTVSAQLWERIAAMGERHGLPIHVHLAQSIEEVERAVERHGVEPTQWLEQMGVLERVRGLFVHGLYLRDADLARLDPKRHLLVWCPRSQAVFGFWARVDRWVANHRPFVVATDCAATNDAMDVQAELAFIVGQRTAPAGYSEAGEAFFSGSGSPRAVWEARRSAFERLDAAVQPAALLDRVWAMPGDVHPKLQAGVLEPGRLANLLVWDLDQPELWPAHDPLRALTLTAASRGIHAMMVAGQWRGEAGSFRQSIVSSPEYREARHEADVRLRALLSP